MSYHKVIIVGNLGRDPEMKYTAGGQAVTHMSVGVNDDYKASSGEVIKRTIWWRVTAWGKQAENCNMYLTKGRPVLVEGRMQCDEKGNPRVFERNDGTHGAAFELNASTVRFMSGGREEAEGEVDSTDVPWADSPEGAKKDGDGSWTGW
jgi:single-strand DNA-binding protein